MKLPERLLEPLARMVIGDDARFPYKTHTRMGAFFDRCMVDTTGAGGSRPDIARTILTNANEGPADIPELPSNAILRIIDELFDPYDFKRFEKRMAPALAELNDLIRREGLEAYFDAKDHCRIRGLDSKQDSSGAVSDAPLTPEQIEQRKKVEAYLKTATEDEFTNNVVAPLFRRLGYKRISVTGHKEKILEYGKDAWMKHQLPTGHWIYFGAQIKRDKIDSTGASGQSNVATIVSQVLMALSHPIFDPDIGRNVLPDHMYIISAAEITRPARNWIAAKLDTEQKRTLIFMDREEFLNHAGRIIVDLPLPDESNG